MQKKTLSFPLLFKSIDQDDNTFKFKGYAAVFNNRDLVDDVIVNGAFADSLDNKNFKLFYQHRVEEMPIGKIDIIKEDELGLWVEATLSLGNQHAKDVAALIKDGILDSMSIGFFVKDSETREDGVNVLKDIELMEVSVVNFPANPKAVIVQKKRENSVMKTKEVNRIVDYPIADRDTPWDREAAQRRVREFTGATEEVNAAYADTHMYRDGDAPNDFDSFHLLFADVQNDRLEAIPNAILDIRALLDQDPNRTTEDAQEEEAETRSKQVDEDMLDEDLNDVIEGELTPNEIREEVEDIVEDIVTEIVEEQLDVQDKNVDEDTIEIIITEIVEDIVEDVVDEIDMEKNIDAEMIEDMIEDGVRERVQDIIEDATEEVVEESFMEKQLDFNLNALPQEDIVGLKRYVNHYYERMDLDRPFDDVRGKSCVEIGEVNKTQLSNILRKGQPVSRKGIKKILSQYKFIGLNKPEVKSNEDEFIGKVEELNQMVKEIWSKD